MPFSNRSRGPVLARILFVLAVLKLGAPPTVIAAEGTVRIIATSGDPAPDGNGSLASFFLPFLRQPIAVNRSGQVAFPASLTGTSGGSTDNFGLFVGDGSSIRQIARKGDTLPYGDDKLLFFTSLSRIDGLSDAGEVAFHSNLSDASGNSLDEIALLRSDGAGLRVIARRGSAAPDGNGTFNRFDVFSPESTYGDAAVLASLTGTSGGAADDSGIFLGNGTGLTQIVREGQPSPDANGRFSPLQSLIIAGDSGQVSFVAELIDTVGGAADNSGLFRGDGVSLHLIAREGQLAPNGNDSISVLGVATAPNSSGQVAFSTLRASGFGGAMSSIAILMGDGANLSQLVGVGDTAPDGNGEFSSFPDVVALNDAGSVLFQASLTATAGGTSADSGLFRTDGSTTIQIAREGQAAPDGNGVFSFFLSDPVINQAGQVAFQARLSGSSSGVANDFGLYFFDDQLGLTQIARVGDAFLGSTISSIFAFPAGGRGGSNFSYSKMTLNQEGRPIIAYGVGLADGRSVIALWELVPEPGSLAIAAVGAVAISAVAGWPMRKRSRS